MNRVYKMMSLRLPGRFLMGALLAVVMAMTDCMPSNAQIVATPHEGYFNTDSIRRDFRNQPYFGLYKDNYFVFGPPIGRAPTAANTNVKFQISIAQRLTRANLFWGTYLYLFYTQKVFWNILQDSMPMTDLNFNPGIGLTKPLFVNNRYIGKATLMIEHESNGKDSTASRSWERISLCANVIVNKNMMVHGKIWIPILDGMHNKDLLNYVGLYQTGVQFMSNNGKWVAGVTLMKRAGKMLNYNTIVDIAFRINRKDNQFLFMQYYNGYGEGLLDYKQFHTQLRVGICIRPRMFSDF